VDGIRPWQEIFEARPFGDGRLAARLSGFGGDTLGVATLAAARSCPERELHSLHSYFLRPVPIDRDVEIHVEHVRDGRRLAMRRVQLRDGELLLFELHASFAAEGSGLAYQETRPDPGLPGPDALPDEEEVARQDGIEPGEPGPLFGPLEWRWLGAPPWRDPKPGTPSRYDAWVRPRGPIPVQDRALQAAVLAFTSDYHSHLSVARILGGFFEPVGYVSLDQVLWLHHAPPWDDWWLMSTWSDVACAGRALTTRKLFGAGGHLVASMAQEALLPDVGQPAADVQGTAP
jgi:acyl-CoA thioesterase-2